jgi:metal-responsive CopG/Arc/MetJ family transcriptional regulator
MTRLTVRLPDRVHQGIEDIAQFQRESLNEQIVKAAEAYIQEFAAKVQAGEIKTTPVLRSLNVAQG